MERLMLFTPSPMFLFSGSPNIWPETIFDPGFPNYGQVAPQPMIKSDQQLQPQHQQDRFPQQNQYQQKLQYPQIPAQSYQSGKLANEMNLNYLQQYLPKKIPSNLNHQQISRQPKVKKISPKSKGKNETGKGAVKNVEKSKKKQSKKKKN